MGDETGIGRCNGLIVLLVRTGTCKRTLIIAQRVDVLEQLLAPRCSVAIAFDNLSTCVDH